MEVESPKPVKEMPKQCLITTGPDISPDKSTYRAKASVIVESFTSACHLCNQGEKLTTCQQCLKKTCMKHVQDTKDGLLCIQCDDENMAEEQEDARQIVRGLAVEEPMPRQGSRTEFYDLAGVEESGVETEAEHLLLPPRRPLGKGNKSVPTFGG